MKQRGLRAARLVIGLRESNRSRISEGTVHSPWSWPAGVGKTIALKNGFGQPSIDEEDMQFSRSWVS